MHGVLSRHRPQEPTQAGASRWRLLAAWPSLEVELLVQDSCRVQPCAPLPASLPAPGAHDRGFHHGSCRVPSLSAKSCDQVVACRSQQPGPLTLVVARPGLYRRRQAEPAQQMLRHADAAGRSLQAGAQHTAGTAAEGSRTEGSEGRGREQVF